MHPARHPKLLQGVTTVVTGHCGISLAPLAPPVADAPPAPLSSLGPGAETFRFPRFADDVAAVRAAAPAVSAALLVGHTTLHAGHVADLDRAASARARPD